MARLVESRMTTQYAALCFCRAFLDEMGGGTSVAKESTRVSLFTAVAPHDASRDAIETEARTMARGIKKLGATRIREAGRPSWDVWQWERISDPATGGSAVCWRQAEGAEFRFEVLAG